MENFQNKITKFSQIKLFINSLLSENVMNWNRKKNYSLQIIESILSENQIRKTLQVFFSIYLNKYNKFISKTI